MSNETEADHPVRFAQEVALRGYLDSRRTDVRRYAGQKFSHAAIWTLHRECFTRDIGVNLINSYLAIPLLTPMQVAHWLEKAGFQKAEGLSTKIPSGLPTRFQKKMEQDLHLEFFGENGPFERGTPLDLSFRNLLKEEIRALSRQRASATDLVASVLPIGVGYLLFRKSVHSVSEIGRRIASTLAKKHAVSHFVLGKHLGSVFYNIFPTSPTKNEILLATGMTVFLIAVLTSFVHLISFSAQNRLGVHERKLNQLLDSLEMKLILEMHRPVDPLTPTKY
jgi:hypothetical protein